VGFDPGAHNNAALSIACDPTTNAQSFGAASYVSSNRKSNCSASVIPAHPDPNFGAGNAGSIVKTNKCASVVCADPDSDSGPHHVGTDATSEPCANVARANLGTLSGADHV